MEKQSREILEETETNSAPAASDDKWKWWIAAVLIPLFAAGIPALLSWVDEPAEGPSLDSGKDVAREVMQFAFNRDVDDIYKLLNPAVKRDVSLIGTSEMLETLVYQFAEPPAFRAHKSSIPIGDSTLIVEFEAEFDSTSSTREIVQLIAHNNSWTLWRIDILRNGWPRPGVNQIDPGDFGSATAAEEMQIRGVLGINRGSKWIPPTGWKIEVSNTDRERVSARTCSIQGAEVFTRQNVFLENVIDGCMFKAGSVHRAYGQAIGIDDDSVRVGNVLLHPEEF